MSESQKKLLVLGGSSFVGKRFLEGLLCSEYVATYAKSAISGGVRFDCTETKLSERFPNLSDFGQALILLGDTDPNSCVQNIARSKSINVTGIKRIIDDLVMAKVKPVFVSSEFVFDGSKGSYRETDLPNPILLYGKQKLEIENYIRSLTDEFIIIRLAKVYGDKVSDGTLFTSWINPICRGGIYKCASDQRFSPIHLDDVSTAMYLMMKGSFNGIFHMGGPQKLSRIQYLKILVSEMRRIYPFELDIKSCDINDFEMPEKRPIDVTMCIDKISAAITYKPRSVQDFCKQLVQKNLNLLSCEALKGKK